MKRILILVSMLISCMVVVASASHMETPSMASILSASYSATSNMASVPSVPHTEAPSMVASSESYDIEEIYERQDLPSDAMAEDGYGSVVEVRALYVPTRLNTGRYDVEVSRVDSNFYRVCGTDIYIKTRYCYEYATYDDAILVIESNYGYTKGEIIFLE